MPTDPPKLSDEARARLEAAAAADHAELQAQRERYIVVELPGHLTPDHVLYAVVDTGGEATSRANLPARTRCLAESDHEARDIADALNGAPSDQLKVARRALIELHEFVESQLDPDPSGDWSSYHTRADTQRLVAEVQHEHQVPF